jgi:hypothetical protein
MTTRRTSWCMELRCDFPVCAFGTVVVDYRVFLKTVWFAYQLG